MRRLLLIFLLFFAVNQYATAQNVDFFVKTLNYTTRKKEAGATVTAYDGASQVQSLMTDASGQAKLQLPAGKKYKVEVSKPGKVTRIFNIDLKNVNDELIQGNPPEGSVEISLFDDNPAIDFSYVKTNPITEFYYDPTKPGDMQFDAVLAEKMLKKIEKLLKDAEAAKGQTDAQYNALIKQADGQFTSKKYQEALASYEQALALKPTEKYPSDKINEIDGILKAEKANAMQNQQAQQEYDNLISAADNLFNQKKFEEAKARYQEALTKKQEQHPKDQIVKCDAEIARLKKEAENAQKYTDAIKAGDAFFTQKSFQAAKDKYKEALKWKADDKYATDKIAEIDGKLNAQKAEQEQKKKYDDALAAADAFFGEEKWNEAKAKYNEALTFQPASTYAKGKIAEIDAKLAEAEKEKARLAQIEKLLAEGNTAFTAQQWAPAKAKYQEVLKLDAANAIATARITEIDGKLEQEKANAQKIADVKKLVTEGDALAKQTKLAEAKAKYESAQALIPDPAVQAKIDAIDEQLAAASKKAEQKQKYDQAMTEGEQLFAAANYEGAKAKFQEASTIDPAQALPKTRIADADKKIAEVNASAAKNEKYTAAVNAGNAFVSSGKLEDAKAKYTEAIGIDGTKQEAKDKLAEVNKLISDKAAADANAAKAEKYLAAVNAGNAALSSGNLEEAKAKYTEAVAIDGTKQEAKDKLADVNKLIADKATAEANKVKYEAAVKAGNDFQSAGKLAEAKAKFEEAQKLDPSQALPGQKITEITNLMANAAKQKQVDELLKSGDAAFGKKDYATARTKYQEVLSLDPSNTIASGKIQEITRLENELAGEAEKEARFNDLKTQATTLMANGKYAEAKQKLNETKAIKQDASVDALIKECDEKIKAAQDAQQAQQKEQEKEQRYAALISEAQGLESSKQYDAAIAKYNEALTVKNEQMPRDRIAAINEIKKASSSEAKINADYIAAIKRGDDLVASGNYTDAIKAYNDALALKPSEKEPVDKAEAARKKAEAVSQDEFEQQYQKVLATGQKYIDEKNYDKAKEMYNRALSFRANDPFPKQKLAEIDNLLKAEEDLKKKQQAYNAKVVEAEAAAKGGKYENAIALFEQAKTIKPDETLPDNRIAELRALIDGSNSAQQAADAKYREMMAAGNTAEGGKEYKTALDRYKDALTAKPNDKAAQDKIAEMKQILDNEAKNDAKHGEVLKLIAKADAQFAKEDWKSAREIYESALKLEPTNNYASSQVNICIQKIKDITDSEIIKEYNKIIAKADGNFDSKNYEKAIDYYNRALSLRANDPYPKQRLEEIDNILHPKPVVANKEPEKLKPLGVETDNSILEGDAALQAAEVKRKQRKHRRFWEGVEASVDKADSLNTSQSEKATATSVTLKTITKENEEAAVRSDEGRQENIGTLKTVDNSIEAGKLEAGRFEDAEHLDAKNQIEVANRITQEQNSVLDGNAADNDATLKSSKKELENATGSDNAAVYERRLDNEKEYMNIQLNLEANAIDDVNERIETEHIVRDASRSVIAVTETNQQRTNQSLEIVQKEVEDVTQEISQQRYEETKQSPVNKEELLKIEGAYNELNQRDGEEHLENTLGYRSALEGVEKKNSEAVEGRDDARKNNVEVMEASVSDKEEVDRATYNELMVKTLATNGAIKTEIVKLDEFADKPQIASGENVEKIKAINDSKSENDRVADEIRTEKRQETQGALNETTQTVSENSAVNMEQSANNAQVLKETKSGLGQAELQQTNKQQDKTQAAKQLLASIEKKEIVYNNEVANDLGKLYPEGVSQEQFEQYDEEGLLTAVVTRRVVVKNGHGDIYVRIQKLNGLTYSKNGEPATEYVWQRETQDATLQRNY